MVQVGQLGALAGCASLQDGMDTYQPPVDCSGHADRGIRMVASSSYKLAGDATVQIGSTNLMIDPPQTNLAPTGEWRRFALLVALLSRICATRRILLA